VDDPLVNDAPVNTVPSLLTLAEDTSPAAISGLSIADVDAGSSSVTTTLHVEHGVLDAQSFSLPAGSTVFIGGEPSGKTLTLIGAVAAINVALAHITYTPDSNFNGADTLTITTDDHGNTGPGGPQTDIDTVAITVTSVNDAPLTINDAITVDEGGTITVLAGGSASILGNDFDADQEPLTAVLVTGPAHGTLTLNLNGTFSYTHDGSETLTDSFTYKANDGTAYGDIATVSITVNPVNDAPVAASDAYSFDVGGPMVGTSVLANDTDADSTNLTAKLVSPPATGTFTLNADGTFTYTPVVDAPGTTTFTYRASDGTADSNIVTVTITANAVNHPPVAINDAITVAEGGTATTLTGGAISVLADDIDAEQDPLTASVVAGPAHGTLTLNPDGTFSYTHDGSETFTDSFTYVANDGVASGNVATVSITINPVNDAPVSINDAITVNEGGTATLLVGGATSILANDIDAEQDPLTALVVTGPEHGALTLNPDGTFTYVHDGSETLTDSFTYVANDGTANGNVAIVSITVNPVNDAPVAINDAIIVAEGGTATLLTGGANSVLVNDIDAEQNPLTATVLTNPAHGTLTLNLDGTFSYTHDGSENFTDSFTYAANDGAATGNVATVSITVNPVNDQTPVANDDSISVAKGGTATGAVLTNDTDGDLPNDVLSVSLASAAAHGSVTLNPDGSFTYVQDGSDTLTDSFTYTVTDAAGHTSNVATVDITSFTPTVLHDDYLFSNVPDIRDVMDGVKSEWLLANDEGQGLTYFTTSFNNPPFTEATYGVIDAANGFFIGHIAVTHVDGPTIDRSADTLGDIIVGANIASTLTGGHGNDIISGGAANDVIFGNDGTDTIFGNGGDDTIVYSTGDIVHGGDDNFDTHDLSHSLGHLGDKLVFTESIDLTDSKYDGKLDGIETISMRDADPVNGPGLALTLNASDVMGISDHLVAATSPTAHAGLEIDLSASDDLYLSVTKDGGTWSAVAAQPSGSDLYLIYGHNNGAGEDAYVMVSNTTGHVHLNQDAPHA
jgi:VCBS repeat-containing protein